MLCGVKCHRQKRMNLKDPHHTDVKSKIYSRMLRGTKKGKVYQVEWRTKQGLKFKICPLT